MARNLTLDEAAAWVVTAFGQANTASAVERLGSRGTILRDAVRDLQAVLTGEEVAYLKPTWVEDRIIDLAETILPGRALTEREYRRGGELEPAPKAREEQP